MARKKSIKEEVNDFVDNLLDEKTTKSTKSTKTKKESKVRVKSIVDKVDIIYLREPDEDAQLSVCSNMKNIGNIYVIEDVMDIWDIPKLTPLFYIMPHNYKMYIPYVHEKNYYNSQFSLEYCLHSNTPRRFTPEGIRAYNTINHFKEQGIEALDFELDEPFLIDKKELFKMEYTPNLLLRSYYGTKTLK